MRFICHGGVTLSKNDNQIHIISSHRVAELYNIPSRFYKKHDVILCNLKFDNLGLF